MFKDVQMYINEISSMIDNLDPTAGTNYVGHFDKIMKKLDIAKKKLFYDAVSDAVIAGDTRFVQAMETAAYSYFKEDDWHENMFTGTEAHWKKVSDVLLSRVKTGNVRLVRSFIKRFNKELSNCVIDEDVFLKESSRDIIALLVSAGIISDESLVKYFRGSCSS